MYPTFERIPVEEPRFDGSELDLMPSLPVRRDTIPCGPPENMEFKFDLHLLGDEDDLPI